MASYRAIMITGGAGFIGSHVVDAFVKAASENTLKVGQIVVADVFDYCASKNNIQHTDDCHNVVIVEIDICNLEDVRRVFQIYNVDAVLHLAAQSHVDNSFGNSLSFTDVNVRGTHNLLEAAREEWSKDGENMSEKRFLHISTDEVYGSCVQTQHSEATSLLQPTNPYAASKAAAEMYVESYRHSYGIPTLISRSNNVYGPRQYPEKVIPKFILRLQSGLLPRLQGDGLQQRSFLYATDVAEALLLLFQFGSIGGVYNIGTDNEVSIKELATLLTLQMQPDLATNDFKHDQDRPFNDRRYHLSTQKIKTELNWEPKISLQIGLSNTILWYSQIDHSSYWQTLPANLFADD